MADFCITGVRYNKERTHIDYVQVREEIPEENKLGKTRIVPRVFVADLIRLGKAKFKTRIKNSEGLWASGADVHIFEDWFLTTSPNGTELDNLANLPEV
jgi:hypothetical protein